MNSATMKPMTTADIYSQIKACPRIPEQVAMKNADTARIASALAEREVFRAFIAANPSRKHLADEAEIAAWAAARR